MAYHCPRCGKIRRENPERPPLYYVPREAPDESDNTEVSRVSMCRGCTDPLYICDGYDPQLRDPFWPDFAHPRWLSCEQLYSKG